MMPNCIVKINLMFGTKKIKKKVITQKVIYILMLKKVEIQCFAET